MANIAPPFKGFILLFKAALQRKLFISEQTKIRFKNSEPEMLGKFLFEVVYEGNLENDFLLFLISGITFKHK